MPIQVPPEEALREFHGATTRHVRRIEIYEADGKTRWAKDTVARLKSGSVSVDYARDERRTLDLVLDNADRVLVHAPGEFWYDKIIKVFRGVWINQGERHPRILILADREDEESVLAPGFRDAIASVGYGSIVTNTAVLSWAQVRDYDIFVALGSASAAKLDILHQAYMSGKSVYLQNETAGEWTQLVFPGKVTTAEPTGTMVVPAQEAASPLAQGWLSYENASPPDPASNLLYAVDDSQFTIAGQSGTAEESGVSIDNPTFARVASFYNPAGGGRAVAFYGPVDSLLYDVPAKVNFLQTAFNWLNTVQPLRLWETQIGEFMIDRISQPHFPREVKITGRDYTKKCLGSKFVAATQYAAGDSLEGLINSIASTAGISKRNLPTTGVTVTRTFFWDRGVDRWAAMKEIANAYAYDIYFDTQGYLTITPQVDPATQAPTTVVKTGKDGTLASYEKSTSDTRIYNVVVVTGESADEANPPVFAVARNDDPTSPASTVNIGERVYQYTSSFITTTEQAQNVADKFLAIHSLEEFELSFESLVMPWLEVGDIVGWVDPRPAPGDPSAFLLSSITIPLSLGTMSANGKRVMIVG